MTKKNDGEERPPKPADPCGNGCTYVWKPRLGGWVLQIKVDCPDWGSH